MLKIITAATATLVMVLTFFLETILHIDKKRSSFICGCDPGK
jgi:hypothetical protein